MQARSFIDELRASARHFYATSLRGEVSDANVRGYLRAATQIEEVWQQIDERVKALIEQGTVPWSAYAQLRYPLAFIRAARTYQVFVRELLAADAASDPQTAGYLPPVTYDQANALCHQIQPNLEHAVQSLNNPQYTPDVPLPLILGPRIESEGRPCPVPHLQGMISAAREVREWAAGLLAEYDNALSSVQAQIPAAINTHRAALQALLAQADSQLRFGVDLVGQISQGGVTPELHEEAETSLWSALQNFFLLNQAVAAPELLQAARNAAQAQPTQHKVYRDRRIRPDDLWMVAAPSARAEIRGTEFGRDEMNEMCGKMGGILSAGAQQYLDEVAQAEMRGDIVMIAAMANCPFEPLYRAKRQLEIAGANIPATYEFHWNFHRGHIEVERRFGRVGGWQECDE